MNQAFTKFIYLFIFISFPVIAQQDKAWTLQECIEYALKNNIQIKQSELNTELTKENLTQSRAALLPNLNANASHIYNFGRTIDPFTNQFATDRVLSQNFSLSSNVTLFNGLQTFNTIKQNQYAYMAGRYNVQKIKNDISLNIASAYLQILFSMELVDIALNQTQISSRQVERTKQLVDAGTLAKGGLLDVQAQQANDELTLANAQNQLDLAYLNLTQLLDLDSAGGFKIAKPEIALPEQSAAVANPEQIYSIAVSNQPDVKREEFNLKSSEKGVAIAKGAISPRLTLSGSYGTGYSGASRRILAVTPTGYEIIGFTSVGDTVYQPGYTSTFETTPFNDQVKDNLNKSFGLFLTIPLFNGLQTKTSISRAKINRQNALYNLELTKNQLQKNIQQAHADANAALKKYTASQKALDAMSESFKYTEQRFNVGMLNAFDFNDAKNRLVKAQSDVLQAKYDYVFKTKILDFYLGKPLML